MKLEKDLYVSYVPVSEKSVSMNLCMYIQISEKKLKIRIFMQKNENGLYLVNEGIWAKNVFLMLSLF